MPLNGEKKKRKFLPKQWSFRISKNKLNPI
jgi:hypothetical protein